MVLIIYDNILHRAGCLYGLGAEHDVRLMPSSRARQHMIFLLQMLVWPWAEHYIRLTPNCQPDHQSRRDTTCF